VIVAPRISDLIVTA